MLISLNLKSSSLVFLPWYTWRYLLLHIRSFNCCPSFTKRRLLNEELKLKDQFSKRALKYWDCSFYNTFNLIIGHSVKLPNRIACLFSKNVGMKRHTILMVRTRLNILLLVKMINAFNSLKYKSWHSFKNYKKLGEGKLILILISSLYRRMFFANHGTVHYQNTQMGSSEKRLVQT